MMNKSQFQFQRFWRLLRVKFAESIRFVFYCVLVFTAIMLVVRAGLVLHSLDNISEAFEKGVKMIFRMPLLILLCSYFIGVGIMTGSKRIFLCPVSNLERFLVMHILSFFYMMMAAIVGIVSIEILWRLGLWIAFPDAYAQYIEVVAKFPYMEKFFSNVVGYIVVFSAPYFYYETIGSWEKHKKYKEKKQKIIFYWLIPIVYVIVVVGGGLLLKFLDVPHILSILFSFVIMTDIILIIASYRSFCDIEPNLEKTSNE